MMFDQVSFCDLNEKKMLYPPVPQAYAAGVPTNRLLDIPASWPAEQVILYIYK